MKFVSLAVALVLALACASSTTARAEMPSVIAKISAEDLAQLLSRIGLFAVVDEENDEKFVVPFGFFNRPLKSEVRLQECSADGCGRLVFKTWPRLRADLKWTNKWNRAVPLGLVKTSLLPDKTIRIEMTVDLTGGVSPQFIEQSAFAFVTLSDRVFPGNGLN
jgi:hypothetical protein